LAEHQVGKYRDIWNKKQHPASGVATNRSTDIHSLADKNFQLLKTDSSHPSLHHTAESLNKRNHEFYELADKFHLESYDGMDVGPTE
jgi:hypothetical protein